ncbi:hypothetical protein [Phyllobacterium sp. SB3]|uniref:hypothetical protein n=1 Tax=Phyllobacterium sp. SB3 TaxID=3156073 RepID=UPI0032AFE14C
MATHKSLHSLNEYFAPTLVEQHGHLPSAHEEVSSLLALTPPLKCTECDTLQLFLAKEAEDLAPIHCPECGAFVCTWKDIVKSHIASEL